MKRISTFFIISFLFILSCEDKVEIDTTPPTLNITSLSNGEVISDKVVIKITTEDDKEISKVEFYIDDSLKVTDTNTPYEYEWDTFPYKNGEYSIKIISYDLSENFSEESLSVIVYNKRIVFQSNGKICVIDVNGNNYTELTNGYSPKFSPDGTKILFRYGEGKKQIHIMDYDGKNITKLTNDQDYGYEFSPDGKKIGFISFSDSDQNGQSKIFIMNSDGTNQTKLSDYQSDFFQFSPDGNRIVFVTELGDKIEIYSMNIDGTDVTQLTNDDRPDYYPQYYPDGSKILFLSYNNRNGNYEFIRSDLNGRNRSIIGTSLNISYIPYPYFSPDGSRLIFMGTNNMITISDSDPQTSDWNGMIYEDGRLPQFSPDGKMFVFLKEKSNGHSLMTYDLTNDTKTEIYNVVDGSPHFQPPPKEISNN